MRRLGRVWFWGLGLGSAGCLSAALVACNAASDRTQLAASGGSGGTAGASAVGGASGAAASGGTAGAAGSTSDAPRGWGAQWDAERNLYISVRSHRATRIEAWLYAAASGEAEVLRVQLEPEADGVFRGGVQRSKLLAAGLPGTVYYGLRAWGPNWAYTSDWKPGSDAGFVSDVDAAGNRFNPNKLLWDPYALELSHDPINSGQPSGALFRSGADDRLLDSALEAPKGIALLPTAADAGVLPARPLGEQVIYEVQLRGFTQADESLPAALRGTYAGAATKAQYLADLGVTAVEFLPLHETQNDQNDIDPDSAAGDNYWGYSSLSFFAPDRRFASDKSPGGPTRELQGMVKAFHDVGISVFVDVVYNHTGEGGAWGSGGSIAPLYSWRGIDNSGYYQLAQDFAGYQNDNGVGPNIAARSELARDLVIDSLRYWHETLGVDGFRFDLAPILANQCERGCFKFDGEDPAGILRRAVTELPGVALIAEPWGTGPGTFQLGQFPAGWAEWNGAYRDTLRDDLNLLGSAQVTPGWLADRLSGSWSLFGDDGRGPTSSINFLVSHDGFTLRDLNSCNQKQNDQAWPFGPSDGGTDDNRSWDHRGNAAYQRQGARTALALLMVSAGVPMIVGGDELYRTQRCNNNPYNLDSSATWIDWSALQSERAFFDFSSRLLNFRKDHPALRPSAYRPLDTDADGDDLPLVAFLDDHGKPASAAYLDDPAHQFLAFRLDGDEVGDPARSLLVAYNGWSEAIVFDLPPVAPGLAWHIVCDTSEAFAAFGSCVDSPSAFPVGDGQYVLPGRSVLIAVEQ